MGDSPNDADVYERLFNMAADAMILHKQGKIMRVNQAACDSLGYTREELMKISVRSIETSFDAEKFHNLWKRMVANPGQVVTLNGVHQRKDGSTFPVEVATRMFELDGETVNLAVVRDVSSQRRLERQVEAALTRHQATVENMDDGLVSLDEEGQVELWNPAFSRLYGVAGQLRGRTLEQLGASRLQPLVAASLESDCTQRDEITLPGDRLGSAAVSTMRRSDGSVLGTVIIIRDVTFQKEVERMKTEFTAMVTHELRTPMTSVLGFARLTRGRLKRVTKHVPEDDIRAMRAADQCHSNLDIIISEGERLTALITTVLDIAKMEAGGFDWKLEPCSAKSLVKRAMSATDSLIGDSAVSVSTQVDEEVPKVRADSDRIIQVLINLLSNALKFTSEGSVAVRVGRGEKGVEFSVEDTGTGIAEADQDQVFQKYKQVGGDHFGGTGLGLPICREIVQAHGGEIWVDSQLGSGSRFAFWLPEA